VAYKQIVNNDVTGTSLLYKLQYRGKAAMFSKKNALHYRPNKTKLRGCSACANSE
jgi:hypothetical protein